LLRFVYKFYNFLLLFIIYSRMEQAPRISLSRPKPKNDQVMKRILSAFRRHLKDQYRKMYDRRYYYWIPSTLR
jgi:hypothetical protein